MVPPLRDDVNGLILYRVQYDDNITIYMPWGDSYYCSPDEVRMYLKMLGVPKHESIVDYVWNFYRVYVGVPDGRIIKLQEADVEKFVQSALEKHGERQPT